MSTHGSVHGAASSHSMIAKQHLLPIVLSGCYQQGADSALQDLYGGCGTCCAVNDFTFLKVAWQCRHK